MGEKGQAELAIPLLLLIFAVIALLAMGAINMAERVKETGKSKFIDIAPEPNRTPVQIEVITTGATDTEIGFSQCVDAFPYLLQPSEHLLERVSMDTKRLTAWMAIKHCGHSLRTWYCPAYTNGDGQSWAEFVLECRGEDGKTCAVGIVSTAPGANLPPTTRVGITAYLTSCEGHMGQMQRRGCFPVNFTFVFP